MIKIIKSFYHLCKKYIELIVVSLLKRKNVRLAHLLSIIVRWFFLREFKRKEPNFRNVEDLKKLVSNAIIEENKKFPQEQSLIFIPKGLKVLFVYNSETTFKTCWVETAVSNDLTIETFFANKISYLSSKVNNSKVFHKSGYNTDKS